MPTPFAGSIKIVDPGLIEPLETSLGELSEVLGHFGIGSRQVFASAKNS